MKHHQSKILVIEDDDYLLNIITERFQQAGFEVIPAKDGEEGLAKINDHPDVIILDIVLPKIDGLSLLKEITRNPASQSAAVIILTNINRTELVIDAAREHKVAGYLFKSNLKLEDLVKKVQTVLSNKQK